MRIQGSSYHLLLSVLAGAAILVTAAAAQDMGRRPVPSYGRAEPAPTKRYLNPGPTAPAAPEVENPYAGNPDAIAEGGRLFAWFHCAECHGPAAGGFIGPSLRDPYWRFGGEPASIYQSIWAGRPRGMPTWGDKIPDDQIWKLVAYLQSLQDPEPDALQPGSAWQ